MLSQSYWHNKSRLTSPKWQITFLIAYVREGLISALLSLKVTVSLESTHFPSKNYTSLIIFEARFLAFL